MSKAQTPGERIAETVYYLDEGDTYASVEGKRAALAKKIDVAIEREIVAQRAALMSGVRAYLNAIQADDNNKYAAKGAN